MSTTRDNRHRTFIGRILAAAKRHGEQSEPDHEVGDLQVILRAMWRVLTPEQRDAFMDADECRELLLWWQPGRRVTNHDSDFWREFGVTVSRVATERRRA